MAGSEEWRRVTERIAHAESPRRSPELSVLYQFACKDAQFALRRFPAWVREQAEDITQDLIFEKLDALLNAPSPRGLFMTSVKNAAIDLQRKEARRPSAEEPIEDLPSNDGSAAVESRVAARLDARRITEQLTVREREIFSALAVGEERDDIAAALGTSRANIDQVVSRARKRLTEPL